MTMKITKADSLELIINELKRAEELHPRWPEDILHAVAIVNEEAGEVTKAASDFVYNNGPLYAVQKELVQTAAMCVRMLLHIGKYYQQKLKRKNHE